MEKEEIVEKFKEILKPYTKNPENLDLFTEHSDFVKDLNINSANMVDVFLDAEEVFDIELDNESLEKITNVNDAINTISQKLEEKA